MEQAGLPKAVVQDQARLDTKNAGVQRWIVGCMVPRADAQKTKLQRSIEEYVDDRDKRKCFVTMVGALFDAIQVDDYQAALLGGPVSCKPAKNFKFETQNHTLWELKNGNKDRIYFFPVTKGPHRVLVLLKAYHKKDQRTPDEIDPCVDDAKDLIRCHGDIEFC